MKILSSFPSLALYTVLRYGDPTNKKNVCQIFLQLKGMQKWIYQYQSQSQEFEVAVNAPKITNSDLIMKKSIDLHWNKKP